MRCSARVKTGKMARLVSVAALAVVALGCQSSEVFSATGGAITPNSCYLDVLDVTPENAESVVTTCSGTLSDRRTGRQLTNANFHLGRAYALLGRFTDAAGAFERVLSFSPGRDDARLEQAKVFARQARTEPSPDVRQAKFQRALDRLNEVVAPSSDRPPATTPAAQMIRALAQYERGRLFIARNGEGDVDRAVRDLEASSLTVPAAREDFVQIVSALGQGALDAPPTPLTTRRAIEMFNKAQTANPRLPGPYIGLGLATMRLAGFYGPRQSPEFGCAPDQADREMLEQALGYFDQAVLYANPDPPQAHAEAGCALLSLNRVREATGRFRTAVELAQGAPEYQIKLARSFMRAGQAPAAVASYQTALAGAMSDADKAEVYVELADAYRAEPRQDGAEALALQSLQQATRINPNSASARLTLGRIFAERVWAQVGAASRIEGTDDYIKALNDLTLTDNYRNAMSNFTEAETYGEATGDNGRRAEALYQLSRLESLRRNPSASDVVGDAETAVTLSGGDWRYREQACLARIRVGRVRAGDDEARLYCTAGENRTDPRALVLEGMFYLRRAHYLDGYSGARKVAWENAYKAFADGARAMGAAPPNEVADLRAKLEIGQGVAHYCVGFANVGRDAINGANGDQRNARAYFTQYRVNLCDLSRG